MLNSHKQKNMQFHEKAMQDFKRTKRILRSTELDLSGWNLEKFDAEKSGGAMVNCYLFDLPTRWIWMCSVPCKEFVSVSEQSHGAHSATDDVRSGLARLIGRRADGKSTPSIDGQDWEDQLALFACAYAGTTQAWALADHFRRGGHFVVINYRKPKAGESSLRPFAIPEKGNPGSLVPAEEFINIVEYVISQDRRAHPEWFR